MSQHKNDKKHHKNNNKINMPVKGKEGQRTNETI